MPKLTAQVLTERIVMAASSEGKPYIYMWDAKVAGFGVRVRAAGRRTWVFRWRRHGRQRIDEIGTYRDSAKSEAVMQLAEARRIALELRVSLDRGEEPSMLADSASPTATLAEIWPKFVAHKSGIEGLTPKTMRVYKNNWETHVASPKYGIADMPITEVKRLHVVGLQKQIAASARARHEVALANARKAGRAASIAKLERQAQFAGNGAASRVVALVSSVYSWMVGEGLLEVNPCDGIANLRTAGKDKTLVLTKADALEAIALIRKHAPTEASRDALLIVLLTCQRDSDIREREWPDLVVDDPDVGMPYLRVEKHKSRRRTEQAKLVPLGPEVAAIVLARHPGAAGLRVVARDGSWFVERSGSSWPLYPSSAWGSQLGPATGPIFPGRIPTQPLADLWHAWQPCRDHARSKRVQASDVHNLRHGGASLMRAAGVPKEMIQAALNHGSADTTEIYLTQTADFFAQLGRALGGGLGLDE